MEQARISEIKSLCDTADKHFCNISLITDSARELIAEVEQLQTDNYGLSEIKANLQEDIAELHEQVKELQEKQTAKAAEHFPQGLGQYDLNVPACPCCKNIVVGKPNNCQNCGQKLKWEE